jgi:hypothetical protein
MARRWPCAIYDNQACCRIIVIFFAHHFELHREPTNQCPSSLHEPSPFIRLNQTASRPAVADATDQRCRGAAVRQNEPRAETECTDAETPLGRAIHVRSRPRTPIHQSPISRTAPADQPPPLAKGATAGLHACRSDKCTYNNIWSREYRRAQWSVVVFVTPNSRLFRCLRLFWKKYRTHGPFYSRELANRCGLQNPRFSACC